MPESITIPGPALKAIANSQPVKAMELTVDRQELPVGGNVSPEKSDEQNRESSTVELAAAVSHISDHVQQISRDLQFKVDETTGSTVVTVIDSESKEIIRQIPREEAVALAHYLAEIGAGNSKGLFVRGEG
tara:strand:+ start:13206 stop:13598 length:393 start_codon:yes stop_codon:yes gene_type:complete